jgi:hypothetical protein
LYVDSFPPRHLSGSTGLLSQVQVASCVIGFSPNKYLQNITILHQRIHPKASISPSIGHMKVFPNDKKTSIAIDEIIKQSAVGFLDFDDWQVATTMSRPEYLAPPEIYYNDQEAKKYLTSTRMNEIQRSLTERLVSFVTC